jgi:hypothetical protein
MKKKNRLDNIIDAAKNLLKNRVSISAAQDLVLKSLLDKLQEEVIKLDNKKNI